MTYSESLRELADWYDAHPEFPAPYDTTLHVFAETAEELKVLRRAGRLKEKTIHSEWVYFRKNFGPHVCIQLCLERDKICKRVKTGEEVLPAEPEHIVPAKPERVVDVFEWQCPEHIL